MKKIWIGLVSLIVLAACSVDANLDMGSDIDKNLAAPLSESELIRIHLLKDISGSNAQDGDYNQRYFSQNTNTNVDTLVMPVEANGSSPSASGVYTLGRVSVQARKMSVIVNSGLYTNIQDKLGRYLYDLQLDGYEVILHVVTPSARVQSLKDLIKRDYQNKEIRGVFVIGQFPVAWYEINDFNSGSLATFPMDLYFTDMDGEWQDVDGNGIFDSHTGDVAPEIWMGRLNAAGMSSNSGKTEVDRINDYFDKDHAYRVGKNRLNNRALIMINRDWKNNGFESFLKGMYDEETLIKDPESAVTSDRYRQEISGTASAGYESLLLASHSSWSLHSFNSGSYFRVNEIEKLAPKVEFYNLFACSAARFTEADNLASWYVLQKNFGLNSIGSTKSGGMLDFQYYYAPLSTGESLGDSLLSWFRSIPLESVYRKSWHYGIVMMGDPTLRLSRYQTPVADNYTNRVFPSLYIRGTFNNWKSTPMRLVAPNLWQAVVTFGNASTERFKLDVYGDWTYNLGDQNLDGIADKEASDIPVTQGEGTYQISFNDKTGVYTIKKVVIRGKVNLHLKMNGADFRVLEGESVLLRKDGESVTDAILHSDLSGDNGTLTFDDLPVGTYDISWKVLRNQKFYTLSRSFSITEVQTNLNLDDVVMLEDGKGSANFAIQVLGSGTESELIGNKVAIYRDGVLYSSNRIAPATYGNTEAFLSVGKLLSGNYRVYLSFSKQDLHYTASSEFSIDDQQTHVDGNLTVNSRLYESLYDQVSLTNSDGTSLPLKLSGDHLWKSDVISFNGSTSFLFETYSGDLRFFGDFNADGKFEQNGSPISLPAAQSVIVWFNDKDGTYGVDVQRVEGQARVDFHAYYEVRKALFGQTASLYSNQVYLREVMIQDNPSLDFPFGEMQKLGMGNYRLTVDLKHGITNYFGNLDFVVDKANTNFHGNMVVSETILSNFEKNEPHVYFRGTPNSWSVTPMRLIGDHLWSITVEVKTNGTQIPSFKFDVYGDWSENFGDQNLDGIADREGKNIFFESTGIYKILFNDETLAYSVKKI